MKNRESYQRETERSVETFISKHQRNAFLQPVGNNKDPFPNGEPIDVLMAEIDYKQGGTVTKYLDKDILVITGQSLTNPLVVMEGGRTLAAFGTMGVAASHFKSTIKTIKECCRTKKKLLKKYDCEYITKETFREIEKHVEL